MKADPGQLFGGADSVGILVGRTRTPTLQRTGGVEIVLAADGSWHAADP